MSLESDSDHTSASSDRYPQPVIDRMSAQYGGKRCILTGGVIGVEYAHLVPATIPERILLVSALSLAISPLLIFSGLEQQAIGLASSSKRLLP